MYLLFIQFYLFFIAFITVNVGDFGDERRQAERMNSVDSLKPVGSRFEEL